MALIKLSAGEVRLNQPIDFAIFSHTGKLLLSEGYRIQSERQLERLFADGAFRDDAAQASRERRPAADQAATQRPLISEANHRAASATFTVPSAFPVLPDAFEGFQLTVAGVDQSIHAKYIGKIDGQGLLVSATSCDALTAGVAVRGRLLFGRDIYAFDTRVVTRSTEIAGVVLLEAPQSVTRHRVRRHPRVNVSLPARLIRNDSSGFDVTVVNLSVDGLGLVVDEASLKPGEYFRLALRIAAEGRTHTLTFNCIAQNVRVHPKGFAIGAQIHAATAESKAVLRSFVFESVTGAAT